MFPFVLYLITGCATAIQVLSLVLFVVWGRPIAPLEIASLLGSATLVGLAVYSLFNPRRAAKGALYASIWMFGYYSIAISAAVRNITFLGSEYPIQLFVPPALLLATAVYSIWATKRRGAPAPGSKKARPWWIVVPLGLAIAGIAPFISFEGPVPDDFFVPRKIVTVSMSWKRQDNVYGPNFISLESSCPISRDNRCFCAAQFSDGSKEFADYISSFGSARVPVRYEVLYGSNGEAVSANFVGVGNWSNRKFRGDDGDIGSGASEILPGSVASISRTPQDCFTPIERK